MQARRRLGSLTTVTVPSAIIAMIYCFNIQYKQSTYIFIT
ncbi:hypothetical protein EDWATA_02087 [Edwardsiella tarda ATCC 23685]|uniref:Uncharacterized protein n=1 Tax=Edwardsiella tarda ATCC 23685 TaxID=500638 RepID=D4F5Q9_EDWTA|nr:hypothetical protein EDWATA_02087 [Edwardsiella tarda ATCC 23685]